MSITELIDYEHRVAGVCDMVKRKGLKIDVDYTRRTGEALQAESEQWRDVALALGCKNVDAPASVVEALLEMGAKLTERTDTGGFKSDNKVLEKVHEQAPEDSPLRSLTDAILAAKRLSKRKSSYTDAMLENLDKYGRVHASINPLAARTARMSINSPPFQQLPSDEALIRNCIIAEDGFVIISSDYDQIEMRVAAELSGEERMIEAAIRGESMHEVTAYALFPDWDGDKHGKPYKVAKGAGFCWLFGGGADTMSKQAGIPHADAVKVLTQYREAFPTLAAFKRTNTEEVLRQALTPRQYRYYKDLYKALWDTEKGSPERAEIQETMSSITAFKYGTITTLAGRRLKVDADRAYSATNYKVQETARNIMATALLNMSQYPKVADKIILPVHDEILGEVPEAQAETYARVFGEIMSTTLGSVPITASGEVYGRSWGEGYQ